MLAVMPVKSGLRSYGGLQIAYGSLMESYNQLIIAADLKYIDEENIKEIQPQIDTVARMLNGLRSSLKAKIEETVNRKR